MKNKNIQDQTNFLCWEGFMVKFMFSKKATKIEEIFTGYLTLCSKYQIDGEDFFNFCGLLRKHEIYQREFSIQFFQEFRKAFIFLIINFIAFQVQFAMMLSIDQT